MARAQDRTYPQPQDEAHDPCLRGDRCSGGHRDPETQEWHPAPAAQHLCTTCQMVLAECLTAFPGIYARLAVMSLHPSRAGRAVRVPPGSRVLASPEADALMREAADVTGGWAARVRAVPQLSLTRHAYPHGSTDQVAADCKVLAAFPDPLLALPVAPVTRTWTYLPGKTSLRPAPVPCRRCGLPVTPAPSGKRWWPAVCSHPSSVPAAYGEDADGNPVAVAWACAACSKRLPAGWQPPAPCDHLPSAAAPPQPAPPQSRTRTIGDVEDEIAHLEVVRAGDGWVTAVTFLHGGDAACELIDLRHRATRLLRETPAPPETFDGVPCRECDEMSSLERAPLPAGAADPEHDPYSRCSVCRAAFTREEHDEWTAMYAAWARGSGILVCARCGRGDCGSCSWDQCTCRARGHAAA